MTEPSRSLASRPEQTTCERVSLGSPCLLHSRRDLYRKDATKGVQIKFYTMRRTIHDCQVSKETGGGPARVATKEAGAVTEFAPETQCLLSPDWFAWCSTVAEMPDRSLGNRSSSSGNKAGTLLFNLTLLKRQCLYVSRCCISHPQTRARGGWKIGNHEEQDDAVFTKSPSAPPRAGQTRSDVLCSRLLGAFGSPKGTGRHGRGYWSQQVHA